MALHWELQFEYPFEEVFFLYEFETEEEAIDWVNGLDKKVYLEKR